MGSKKIYLSIVTPEKKVFEGEVNFISLPAKSGSLGILPGHIPIISQLGIGIVKIETDEGYRYIGIHKGYLEFLYNKANILTERVLETTFEGREETVKKLKEKHEIVQEVTEETKRIARAMASLKSLRQ